MFTDNTILSQDRYAVVGVELQGGGGTLHFFVYHTLSRACLEPEGGVHFQTHNLTPYEEKAITCLLFEGVDRAIGLCPMKHFSVIIFRIYIGNSAHTAPSSGPTSLLKHGAFSSASSLASCHHSLLSSSSQVRSHDNDSRAPYLTVLS